MFIAMALAAQATFWTSLVAGSLGGGIIAALIAALTSRSESRRLAERNHLDECLAKVYGPVVRLLRDCEMAIAHSNDVHAVYDKKIVRTKYDPSSYDNVKDIAKAMIDTANDYVEILRPNVDEVLTISATYWHLVDVGDIPVFEEIRRHRDRVRLEFEEANDEGRSTSQWMLSQEYGVPVAFDPKWLRLLQESYELKLARFQKLTGQVRWLPFSAIKRDRTKQEQNSPHLREDPNQKSEA